MGRRLLVLAAVLSGCAGPPPEAPRHETEKAKARAPASRKDDEVAQPDAAAAEAEPADTAAVYSEPPPQVVHRFHVFGTMKARAAKKVVMTSVLTTAADDAETLQPGSEALLEFKAKGAKEWVAVAVVTVKKITTKGSRVQGTERQELELELTTEHPAAKAKGAQSPFLPRSRVRLQVDRPELAK